MKKDDMIDMISGMRTEQLLAMGEEAAKDSSPCERCSKEDKKKCGNGCKIWKVWFAVQWRSIRAACRKEADA